MQDRRKQNRRMQDRRKQNRRMQDRMGAGHDGFRQCCGSKYIKFRSESGVILSILKEKFQIILEKIIFFKTSIFFKLKAHTVT